jgi:hypothetical protein
MPLYPPTTGSGGGGLLQTAEAHVTVDTTTTSHTFVDLLSVTLTTSGGALLINAGGAINNSNAGKAMQLRVTLNTVSQGGVTVVNTGANAVSFGMAIKVAAAAGSNTIALQWLTPANTAQCRPVTQADLESASLVVQEVSV